MNNSQSLCDKIESILRKNGDETPLKELILIKLDIIEKLDGNANFVKLVDDKIDEHKKLMNEDKLNANQGYIYYQFGRLQLANFHFKKAFKLNPDNDKYFYFQKIIQIEKLLDNETKSSFLYNSRGLLLDKINLFPNAVESFDYAIQIDSNISEYHFNKACSLNKMKSFYLAHKSYVKALELEPDNIKCLYFKEINLIDHELNLKNDNVNYDELHNMKGCFYLKLRDYKNALFEFNEAIKLNELESDYQYHKGIALSEMDNFQQALVCFDIAISLNPVKHTEYSVYKKINNINVKLKDVPNDAYGYNKKGLYLYNLNDYGFALKCFEKAIELNPNEEIFIYNRNRILEQN